MLKLKSDVIVVLKNFIKLVQNQFNRIIKAFRSDNEGEFLHSECSAFFQNHGIKHQRTCVYTPQQNGIAEGKNRHILEVTRALRFQGENPLRYWGQYFLTAVYIINNCHQQFWMVKVPMKYFINIRLTYNIWGNLGAFVMQKGWTFMTSLIQGKYQLFWWVIQ